MKDTLSIKRTAYVCFAILFAYCLLTITYEKSEMINNHYMLFISHKIAVLSMCVLGVGMAKKNLRTPLLQDLLFWTVILYVCAGEFFYPGYNLAYIQLIIAIPLIFSYTGKKTMLYIVVSYILFNVSLHFGQSQLVKASGYESFYFDVLISTLTASCVSFFICILVKKVKDERIEEMRAYYSLGLQSSVFVHDAKASLIQTYRQFEENDNSSLIIEDSMIKLKSMLENTKTTEQSSVVDTFNRVLADIELYVEDSKFQIHGEDIIVNIPEYYLKSVLFNLISNSIRIITEEGKTTPVIELQIYKNGFCLLDNGPGFSEELLKSVSKYTVSSTSNFGTGLGIINSKKLIESFNGVFSLENTSTGSKVSIEFYT